MFDEALFGGIGTRLARRLASVMDGEAEKVDLGPVDGVDDGGCWGILERVLEEVEAICGKREESLVALTGGGNGRGRIDWVGIAYFQSVLWNGTGGYYFYSEENVYLHQ